jgi:hypothetical protein
MQTNYARDIYLALDNIKIKNSNKKKSRSLLAPNKSSFNMDNSSIKNEPLYKIARYKNAIKQKRMEFLNGRNSTT